MDVRTYCVLFFVLLYIFFLNVAAYDPKYHPCCMEKSQNLTLAMIIDAFEIYGHDPTDKLDNLYLYQKEIMKVEDASDQYVINEHVHIASDHLQRFTTLHIKELKVMLIALDDVIDNMLTMLENHHAIAAVRSGGTFADKIGQVPTEFYMSSEFYCGQTVYIFISESYSDIYEMGMGSGPYCSGHNFFFLGFVHSLDSTKYYLQDDPTLTFPTDNFLHGLECHLGVCIYRFPLKKSVQKPRDVVTLPKAIVKCGLVMYKLPPLSAANCVITNGAFILDFNIQGVRYRHHDFLLTTPNGQYYYTKEQLTPLVCNHHVCEWNFTNHYGGPFTLPGEMTAVDEKPVLWVEPTAKPKDEPDLTIPFVLEGCFYFYPPNYGSIAGKSYLDDIDLNNDRFTCSKPAGAKPNLYWYPQWMGVYPQNLPLPAEAPENQLPGGPPVPESSYYPHQNPVQVVEVEDVH